MLSGVGPHEELAKHSIPMIHDLPMLGKNLQDHCFSPIGIVMKGSGNPPANEPLYQSPTPMGWFKLPAVLDSDEFASLPEEKKKFLQTSTVPSFEIATVCLSSPTWMF